MSTQIEHLENHRARLTVEVAPERVEKAMHAAARRIAKQANVPGFRKGKAPYNIIIQRFGAPAVLEEALEDLGNEVFREALDEAKIEPYAPGSLENVETLNAETTPTLKLTFNVPKQPEVDLGSYRDLRIPFEAPTVEDKAVDDAMKALVNRRALVETASRPAQLGDMVKAHIDADRVHPADEAAHEGEDESIEARTDKFIDEDLTFLVTTDEDEEEVMPGFSEHAVGMSAGEQKTFTLAFPEDYKTEALAKHEFHFTIDVKEVQSRTLPVVNDEFAKQVTDNEIDNLLDLRIRVRKDLQESATREAESRYAEDMLDKVVEQATIKHPEEMVGEYVDDILESVDRSLKERGLSLKDYQRIEGKDDEALRADYRDTAIQRLRRALVLGTIVSQEKLDVSDSEVESQIDRMSAQFGEQASVFRNMLSRPESKRNIAVDLITNRAFRRLIEIARGENPPIGVAPETSGEAAPSASAEATAAPAEAAPAEAAPSEPASPESTATPAAPSASAEATAAPAEAAPADTSAPAEATPPEQADQTPPAE